MGKSDAKKPGPDPEVLKIEGDPEEALDKLLAPQPKKPAKKETKRVR